MGRRNSPSLEKKKNFPKFLKEGNRIQIFKGKGRKKGEDLITSTKMGGGGGGGGWWVWGGRVFFWRGVFFVGGRGGGVGFWPRKRLWFLFFTHFPRATGKPLRCRAKAMFLFLPLFSEPVSKRTKKVTGGFIVEGKKGRLRPRRKKTGPRGDREKEGKGEISNLKAPNRKKEKKSISSIEGKRSRRFPPSSGDKGRKK